MMYIGACKGPTAYEIQVGRLYVRLLLFKYWYWPYPWKGEWRFPRFVIIRWFKKGEDLSS